MIRKMFIIPQREVNSVLQKFSSAIDEVVLIRLSSVERIPLNFAISQNNVLDLCFQIDDVNPIDHGVEHIWESGEWGLPKPVWINTEVISKIKDFILRNKEKPIWIIHCDEGISRSPAIGFVVAFLLGDKSLSREILSKFPEINTSLIFNILKTEIFSLLVTD